jgi:hypothetical protein
MRPLVRFACGGSSEAEQLGILSMREECLKGRGQFSLRRKCRPHSAGKERRLGHLPMWRSRGSYETWLAEATG